MSRSGPGRRRARRGLGAAAAFASLCAVSACVPAAGGWDWRDLARRSPASAQPVGERLRDATPYLRVAEGRDAHSLELFLCRWTSEHPLRVAEPPGATPDERALLGLALRAWAEAGLGVRFETVEPDAAAEIRVRFLDDEPGSFGPRSAVTAADCRAQPGGSLVAARIWLERANLDLVGRSVPLAPEEKLGAMLHELGHALGFQGHVASGSSVMVREVDRVRRVGAAVLRGEPLREPTLEALYATPSGTRVGALSVGAGPARALSGLEARARAAGLEGPFTRVGDRAARWFWIRPDGREVGVTIPDWETARRRPAALTLRPDPVVRAGWRQDLDRSGGP